MDVALIQWPDEQARRTEVARRYQPRLLLLQPDTEPPTLLDPLEDWVRVTAAPEDVRARADNLSARFAVRVTGSLSVDSSGLLRFGSRRARLTHLQTRLANLLIDRPGMVVSRAELIEAGWGNGEGEGKGNALEAHLVRLRRRIEPVGLRIRTVRSRGYLLEADSTVQP